MWRDAGPMAAALCFVLISTSAAAADESDRLDVTTVQEVGSGLATSGNPKSLDPNDRESKHLTKMDPIERELRLQRAIAESLKGDEEKALDVLGRPDTDDTASLYAGAMWLMDRGEVGKGVQILEIVSRRPDAPAETDKLLAVGYLHLNQAAKSEAAADTFLAGHESDPFANYIRGLAILNQDEPERAQVALHQAGYDDDEVKTIQQVMIQVPVDVAQRRLTIGEPIANYQNRSRYDDGCDSMGAEASIRPYNFTVLFAGEYDSNVPLQPQFTGLGSDIDHEDYRLLMASFLDVQLLTSADFNLGLIGSTYNTFQVDANEFDIQDYMGGAYTNAMLKDDLVGSLRYEYHHTLVDSTRFADEHRLTPSLTWLGSRGHTTLFYEFNPIDSRAPALIPAQEQAADIHRLGITQAIYTFGGDGRVYVGYQYADALAEGSDFDRTSHMATGRIERPLACGWIGDLDVRYVWDNYDNANSLDFFDRPRDDDRIEVRTGLQKNLNRLVGLRFDYTYINNDSNTENLFGVRFYDYDRHIFSTQLIFSL